MLKIDFRQYQQIRSLSEGDRKAVICVPGTAEADRLSARREAAKLLSGLIGSDCGTNLTESGGICKKRH